MAKSDGAQNQPPKTIPSMAERLRNAPGDMPDEETEIWTGGYSGRAMYGIWMLLGLATLGGIILLFMLPLLRDNKWGWIVVLGALALAWIFSLVTLAVRKLSVWYELTSQRFKHRAGLLVRKSDRIELIDVDDVTFTQGPVQAMLGVGQITIRSSDTSHPELILRGIQDVRKVCDLIDDARRKERRRRGLHIESI
jgi:membrane protein YdbS with pleckstrin-like domain